MTKLNKSQRLKLMRFINLTGTLIWLGIVPIAYYFGWLESVVFVSACSIYANAVSHLAAWRADVDTTEQ